MLNIPVKVFFGDPLGTVQTLLTYLLKDIV
jgi:hypothetical protein